MTWIRLGWTKLRWPTSAMPGNFAVVGSSRRSWPASPATHLSLSGPDSASKRSWAVTGGVVMVSVRDALGLVEVPAEFFRGLRRKQQLPRWVADYSGLPARRVRNEQGERHCNRFAINGMRPPPARADRTGWVKQENSGAYRWRDFPARTPRRQGARAVRGGLHQRLALVGGRDAHGLAIFGNGPTGDIDALLLQDFGDLAVADGLGRRFALHEFLDDRADRGRRTGAAIRGGHVTGEEILEFEYPARRQHVLVGGDALDGGLVHAHALGDIVQHQRFHGLRAVIEESALAVHDGARDLEQGFIAGSEALDEPARLLELVLQVAVVGARVAAVDHLFILAVDAQSRRHVRVEFRAPHPAEFYHDDVGHHVTGLRGGDGIARPRIETLNKLDRLLQFLRREPEIAPQLGVIPARQQGEVRRGGELHRRLQVGHAGWERLHLQAQALGEVARAHAEGIEVLDLVQHRLDLVHFDGMIFSQRLLDLLQLAAQVAVLVDGVDQGQRDLLVGIRKRRHLHLP